MALESYRVHVTTTSTVLSMYNKYTVGETIRIERLLAIAYVPEFKAIIKDQGELKLLF